MKNLELESYGVLEMNSYDTQQSNGGFFGIDDIFIGIAVAAGVEIIQDWDNFKRGLRGECNKAKN